MSFPTHSAMLAKSHEFSLRGRLTRIVIVLFFGSWLVAAVATTQSARSAFLKETDRVLESIVLLADTVGSSVASQLQSVASHTMYTLSLIHI